MIEWRCKNGHVLGIVMPYGAYNCLVLINAQRETIAVITGRADVHCLACGDQRLWRAGDDLIRYLERKFFMTRGD